MPAAPPEGGQPAPPSVGGEALFGAEFATKLFENSPLGVLLSDAQGRCIYTNLACRQITGLTAKQALGMRWSMAVHADDRQRAMAGWADAVLHEKPFRAEVRFQRPDGAITWVRLNAGTGPGARERGADLMMVEDVSDRKAAEHQANEMEEVLYAEKERAQVTLDSIGDAVLVTDLAGKVSYMNLEAETLTGWSSEAAVGRFLTDVFRIVDGDTGQPAPNPAQRAIEEDRTVGLAAGCVLVRRDESEVAIEDSAAPVHGRDGAVTGAVIVFHNVAHSRAEAERLSHEAHHDALTGLVSPALLSERLSQAIGLAYRHHKQVAVLFIDLNRFKYINDMHGHAAGDQVLKAVAARLSGCVRETDTVCRRGGDEFVILLSEIENRRDADQVAEKVLAALAELHALEGALVSAGGSVGISVYPDDGSDVATLLHAADTAMFEVKRRGRGDHRVTATGHSRKAAGRRHRDNHAVRRIGQDIEMMPSQLKLTELD